MEYQIINITIPINKNAISLYDTFTPEENYSMLLIGSNTLKESKKILLNLSNEETYKRIEMDFNKLIHKLQSDIEIEKQTSENMINKVSSIYSKQIDNLNSKIYELNSQISTFENNNLIKINEEIEKEKIKFDNEKQKYELLLEEKDKQNKLNREAFDRALNVMNLTTSAKGKTGEIKFNDIANTFRDFEEFDIQDKHSQSGEGDFHLHFKDFDVLVDAKNYKNTVTKLQKDKIKNDLIKNQHIQFAWLVSLNTEIIKFNRLPIMYEFINTKQCVIYINNLLGYNEPEKILRIAWLFCSQINKSFELLNQDTSNDSTDLQNEIIQLKDTQFKIFDRIKNMKTVLRELNTSINTFKRQIDSINFELKEILDLETCNFIESHFSAIDNWWIENIEISDTNDHLVSTDLWHLFKNSNKEIINNFNINPEHFRKYITSKLPMTCYSVRNKNGAIDINGHKIKNTINIISQSIPIITEVELNNNLKKNKKNKK